jgi:hypothetical protein
MGNKYKYVSLVSLTPRGHLEQSCRDHSRKVPLVCPRRNRRSSARSHSLSAGNLDRALFSAISDKVKASAYHQYTYNLVSGRPVSLSGHLRELAQITFGAGDAYS